MHSIVTVRSPLPILQLGEQTQRDKVTSLKFHSEEMLEPKLWMLHLSGFPPPLQSITAKWKLVNKPVSALGEKMSCTARGRSISGSVRWVWALIWELLHKNILRAYLLSIKHFPLQFLAEQKKRQQNVLALCFLKWRKTNGSLTKWYADSPLYPSP